MESFPAQAAVVDVTVPLSENVPTWPTRPATTIESMRRIARGHPSNVSRLSISSHAGAHVDARWHDMEDGSQLLDIPLPRRSAPCHNDVLIVETLDLPSVDPGPYDLTCLPPKLEVGDGAAARVLLVRSE